MGTSGGQQTLFYVEVETKDRAGPGGGLQEEGELIQVVELSVEQAREYVSQEEVNSPVGMLFGIQWYLNNKIKK